jgi:hypothetical protein
MEPGFYDVEMNDYQTDPCPVASLTSHVSNDLLARNPHYVHHFHPRLGGHRKDSTVEMTNGEVAHTIMFGRGRELVVIEEASYRKASARIERDAAAARGKTPVLQHHLERAQDMVRAARSALATMADGQYAFNSDYGHLELAGVNRDVTGVWTRCCMDFYGSRMPVGVQIWDYKTTTASANPYEQANHMRFWSLQAAFYERIVCQLKPELSGRLKIHFFVQEVEEPYLCSVVTPSAQAMMIAHRRVAAAIAIWRDCLARDRWDSYPNQPIEVSIGSWAENQWLAREMTDTQIKMAANDPFVSAASWLPQAASAVASELPVVQACVSVPEIIPRVAEVISAQAKHQVEPQAEHQVEPRAESTGKSGRPRGQKWTESQRKAARERAVRAREKAAATRAAKAAAALALAPEQSVERIEDELPPPSGPKRIEP